MNTLIVVAIVAFCIQQAVMGHAIFWAHQRIDTMVDLLDRIVEKLEDRDTPDQEDDDE